MKIQEIVLFLVNTADLSPLSIPTLKSSSNLLSLDFFLISILISMTLKNVSFMFHLSPQFSLHTSILLVSHGTQMS